MSDNVEQALSYLGWYLIEPAPVLRPYVKSYWVMQRANPLDYLREEYIHPGGGYGIVFNLGDDFHVDGVPVRERIFLDGSNTVTRRLGFKGKISAIGVRFEPGGAYPFFGVPLHELRNYLAVMDVLGHRLLQDLYEQIAEAKTTPLKIALLERWLLKQMGEWQAPPAIIPASFKVIRHQGGQISMKQLADDLYISQRQLERLYKTQVGMTPVQYGRLLRVDRARSLLKLKTYEQLSTAQIGAELGYYDQSHFIRDFKEIIGITPYQYLLYSQAKEART